MEPLTIHHVASGNVDPADLQTGNLVVRPPIEITEEELVKSSYTLKDLVEGRIKIIRPEPPPPEPRVLRGFEGVLESGRTVVLP